MATGYLRLLIVGSINCWTRTLTGWRPWATNSTKILVCLKIYHVIAEMLYLLLGKPSRVDV